MEKKTANKYTFWQYLESNNIVIPIIQRDYAQGREGKEYLRNKFIKSMKKALESNEPLILDFVYGSEEHGHIYPLDGQQRLTTLWLLHWYIAYKSQNLSPNEQVFSSLTYETRVTSREFMKKLSKLEAQYQKQDSCIIEKQKLDKYIRSHSWFLTAWKNDPTIKAMLTTISGNSKTDKDGNNIQDGLDEIFVHEQEGNLIDYTQKEYQELWEKLTSKECPIIFYALKLDKENLPLSDDLYIKMNARGKALTDFENFKADLVDYAREKYIVKDPEYPIKLGSKLDNTWLDVFWHLNSRPNNTVDEIYHIFINRFLVSEMILNKSDDDKYLYSSDEIQYCKLYTNDDAFEYNDFGTYKQYLSKDILEDLDNVFDFCLKIKINEFCKPYWNSNDSKLSSIFLPIYDNDQPTKLEQKPRIIFSSVCMFIINLVKKGIKINQDSLDQIENQLKDWLHFSWNIAENSDMDGADQMIGIIRFIHKYYIHSNDIIPYLASLDYISQDAETSRIRQLNEEIAKARQIIKENAIPDKTMILKAESSAFFNGTIRFLYTTQNNEICWDSFEKKLNTANNLFDQSGVKDYYRENALLLCHFISLLKTWSQLESFSSEVGITFSNDATNWKKILNLKRVSSVVDELLKSPTDQITEQKTFCSRMIGYNEGYEVYQRQVHEDLTNNTLVNEIINIMSGKGLLHWKNEHYVIYKPNDRTEWRKYIIGDHRNSILTKCLTEIPNFKIDRKIGNNNYFWGWDLPFEYNSKLYRWNTNRNIEVCNTDGTWNYLNGEPYNIEEMKKTLNI